MQPRLTFGYLYDFRNPVEWRKPWEQHYAETLDVIVETERLGFGGAWVPEHHLSSDGYIPSPLIALSAIAARTSKMKLGSGIALAPLYDPVRFAQDCAVLDIIAGGRLEMGLAIGYRRREYAAYGVEFGKRGKIFDEWLEIASRLWAGETVDFDGQFYKVQGAQAMPPAPRGRMPLFIGGFADKAVDRVVQYGEGYIGSDDVCLAYVEKLKELGRDASAAKVRITGLMTVVSHDPEAALEELAPHFLQVNNSYAEYFVEDKAMGRDSFTPQSLEDFKKSGAVQVMTPDVAIAMFKGLQAKMPLDHYMMMRPPGLPAERFLHYAETFAREVLPAFA